MEKDPAALIYIDHWLVLTREMRADCRGWYLNLVLHQFKSGDLPNDLEELANLAGVRISEYDLFQQVWQQVLKQKFILLPTNRLQDEEAAQIIQGREQFKEKRAAAGYISAFTKFIRKHLCQDENVIFFIKQHVNVNTISTSDQHVLKQVFEQLFQLFINKDKDIYRKDVDVGGMGEEEAGRRPVVGAPLSGPGTPPTTPLPGALLDLFVQAFPEYPLQEHKDYAACMQLGYQLADLNGWTWEAANNGRMPEVLARWKEIVEWIQFNSWFRSKSLSFLNGKFQELIQAKNNGTSNANGASAKLGTSDARTAKAKSWGN